MADGKNFTPKHYAILKFVNNRQGGAGEAAISIKNIEKHAVNNPDGTRAACMNEIEELVSAGYLEAHPSTGKHVGMTSYGRRVLKGHEVVGKDVVSKRTGLPPRVQPMRSKIGAALGVDDDDDEDGITVDGGAGEDKIQIRKFGDRRPKGVGAPALETGDEDDEDEDDLQTEPSTQPDPKPDATQQSKPADTKPQQANRPDKSKPRETER